ncbi:hypothetical protein AALB_2848 [Agarivorans albus MKT 106]|uniref:Uncharacterized protein n=1 Tax=Agarivorans albus MKT 106 TaxID=1331007 RepID=R9PNA9_AGAAL|nr:hypothetical protein AALB_2848 [Agarivorans albus MKT 106]
MLSQKSREIEPKVSSALVLVASLIHYQSVYAKVCGSYFS